MTNYKDPEEPLHISYQWLNRRFSPTFNTVFGSKLDQKLASMADNKTELPHIYEVIWFIKTLFPKNLIHYLHEGTNIWSQTKTRMYIPNKTKIVGGLKTLYIMSTNFNEFILQIQGMTIYSRQALIIPVPINTTVNRKLRVDPIEMDEVLRTGFLPDRFFKNREDYIKFIDFTKHKLMDKVLVQ